MEVEGIIQYRLNYQASPLPAFAGLAELRRWFAVCRSQTLIGQDPTRYGGYAYGNISQRFGDGFIISGTQKGGLADLTADDLAWVEAFDTLDYSLLASGPCQPSSEAMTHGQIYQACPGASAVIHVHSPLLWRNATLLDLALTDASAANGTPEMVSEIGRIASDTTLGLPRVIAMGGHQDGIVAYGHDTNSAGELLLAMLRAAERIDSPQADDIPGRG